MEKTPDGFQVPDGALPGQFCRSHIITAENPEGTDCATWLIEGHGDRCPFQSPEHAQQGVVFLGQEPGPSADGVCRDFEPRDFGPDEDWKLKPRASSSSE